jgi:phosphatidylglycerophosphate synthase
MALIWLGDNVKIKPKKKQKPIYLQKKLARLSLMDRQLMLLEDNGFLEVIFITRDKELLESIKRDLEENQWEKKGLRFDFVNIEQLISNLSREEKQNQTEIILNISSEWLVDERIIKSVLETKSYKEEKIENNDSKKSVFIQEDREEFLEKKECQLIKDKFLPIVKMTARGKKSILKQLERKIGKQELINPFEILFLVGLKESYKIINISEIPTYITSMRRDLPIYYYNVKDGKDLSRVKWALVKQTQKGTLDFIAWYFNRPLEYLVVYLIANLPITPNQITVLLNIIAFLVAGCFIASPCLTDSNPLTSKALPWVGFISLIGVNILDGVDGKLARIRGRLTLLGHIEHSFDQLYEQTVYFAACWYCIIITNKPLIPWVLIVVAFLIIDTFNRHVSMQYYNVMRISLADSGKVDRAFRRIDGRRNTYTIHILAFMLLPWKQYLVVSMLVHAAITGIVYAISAIVHLRRADRGIYPEKKE